MSAPRRRLLLVRHGVAEGQEGRVIGHSDPALSSQGRAEIEALLSTVAERPARLLTSDLRRARESAAILATRWGMEVLTDARLRELDFGEWEGRTWQDLEREDGDRLETWMRDWIGTPAPGGESFADLVERVSLWLADSQGDEAAGTTIVVAHAGSIRAILCRLLGTPLEDAFGFDVGHGKVTGLALEGAEATLICRNADDWPRESAPDPEPDRCPLCGEENSCAMAAGKSVSACWCNGARVSREALEQVPASSRGVVCVCPRCVGATPPAP
jgi:alpha-ribazole phosphatase